jgi:hypothetical protein
MAECRGGVMGAPWFKLYAADLLSDSKIRLLTDDQLGKLVKLWAFACKDGAIPSDLAIASRLLGGCSANDLLWVTDFFTIGTDSETGQNMMFSRRMREEQTSYDAKCEKLRISAKKGGLQKVANAIANAKANAVAKPTESESESESEVKDKEVVAAATTVVTMPIAVPEAVPVKRKRRNRNEILLSYSENTKKVVNSVLDRGFWRKSDPDGRIITPDPALLCANVQTILENHQEVTPELLIEAARNYLAKDKQCYSAPQYFFGPGKAGETPKWVAEVQYAAHQAQRMADKEQARLEAEALGATA